jgi:hypothetical protein
MMRRRWARSTANWSGAACHGASARPTRRVSDSGALLGGTRVMRRLRLESTGSGRSGVLAASNRDPWLVRSGPVLLLGSRLEPEWTDLPVTAGFMRFVDSCSIGWRAASSSRSTPHPAIPSRLPDVADAVSQGERA